MIQGTIDCNSPGPSTVCREENAIIPRLSFNFPILIVELMMLRLTIKCECVLQN